MSFREFCEAYGSILGAAGTIIAGIIAFIPSYCQAQYTERALLYTEMDRALRERDALKTAGEMLSDFNVIVKRDCNGNDKKSHRYLRCLWDDLGRKGRSEAANLISDKDAHSKLVAVLHGKLPDQVNELIDNITDVRDYFTDNYTDAYADELEDRIKNNLMENAKLIDLANNLSVKNDLKIQKIEDRLRQLD